MLKITGLTITAILSGLLSLNSQAATITVAAGEVAVNANGICSLREAIANAERELGGDTSSGDCATASAGPDVINLGTNSTYTLPDQFFSSADGATGLPAIKSNITINGNGSTIQRDPALGIGCAGVGSKFRLLFIHAEGDVALNNLTLTNGCADFGFVGAGGAIFNCGNLTVTDSSIIGNAAQSSAGGIQNDGTLSMIRSTLDSNSVSEGAGGGLVNSQQASTIEQSTLSNNVAPGAGGAIYHHATSRILDISNSTISGNEAGGTGGGLQTRGNIELKSSTVASNTMLDPSGLGAGMFTQGSGTATLVNTLVGEQIGGNNCSGNITANGVNIGDDASCDSATVTADIRIGTLTNNGGSTNTHALLTGSPAIDSGDNTECALAPVNNLDQRGVTRPQLSVSSNTCDVGAFELAPEIPILPVPTLSGLALAILLAMIAFFGISTITRKTA